jgi:NADH dehydrogenase [ubiquinone] 1 alpha subcomplex assembly factor 7
MVGVWALVAWDRLGRPPALRIAELGPGRGTLAADLLRAAASFPDFAAALSLDLVELSPGLRAAQRATLGCVDGGGSGQGDTAAAAAAETAAETAKAAAETAVTRLAGVDTRVTWRGALDEVPLDGPPVVYVAHEFFDALPVHQFVRDKGGRCAPRKGVGGEGREWAAASLSMHNLCFTPSPTTNAHAPN